MLSRLPSDLTGSACPRCRMRHRCHDRGTGPPWRRGVAIDISPALVEIAAKRLPEIFAPQVTFTSGDMLSSDLGSFDHVMAMDSMIYYEAPDLGRALAHLCPRVRESVVFTVAPRTAFLMAFWGLGKLFPRSDRSPTMIPHNPRRLSREATLNGATGSISEIERVSRGFYISTCLEYRA
jgi:magnesium-protoporphyrin O-methyltransferase